MKTTNNLSPEQLAEEQLQKAQQRFDRALKNFNIVIKAFYSALALFLIVLIWTLFRHHR